MKLKLKCEFCKNTFERYKSRIKGTLHFCGQICYGKYSTLKRTRFKDYTGQIINGFKILEVFNSGKWNNKYKVLCICGKDRIMSISMIKTTEGICRCNGNKTDKDICLDQVYQRYKYASKFRNHTFELEKEFTIQLIQQNCYYCKSPPSNIHKANKRTWKYSGIDRLNNNLGYISGNCVACCWSCNQIKRDNSFNEFKEKIGIIYHNLYTDNAAGDGK